MNRFVKWIAWCLLATAFAPSPGSAQSNDLAAAFQNPPESARPWVFWYWMNGAVSREGITADLEAMKRAGIGGAYLMPINDVTTPPAFDPPARQLTPEWWGMIKHAFSEAGRLGLQIGMQDCDGFATAGGPWITPELSMQRVVWSDLQLEGGRLVSTNLAQPPTKEDFYRDIVVLAFPAPDGEGADTHTVIPKITTSVPDIDPQFLVAEGTGGRLRSEDPCWVQYEFAEPFTCRSIRIQPDGNNYQALRLEVQTSDDSKTFRSLGRLETPRHGWQDRDADYTFAIVPTTARYFRFVHDPAGSEPGAEDLDSAKWKPILKAERIKLSSAARIPNYEGKSGAVWRKSSRTTDELIPEKLCVPLNSITNLSGFMNPRDGTLRWNAPPGRWAILRIGHTSTGHRNETGGGGKGLECDKLSGVAARVQFENWFAKAFRETDRTLATRVLKVFHVDSWEAGSQNWTTMFRHEFQKRRGYDPLPYMPVFAGVPVGSADISERFLFDVRQTISDLLTENFFNTMARFAHSQNAVFTSEATAPTMLGDGMRHFAEADVPMGEFWLRSPTHDKPNDIHDAISGAHVYGKRIVQAEAYTELRLQWDEQPAMLKALGDHNFALGINRMVYHVFTHNPWTNRTPGMTLNGIGTYFQRDQTWWAFANAWIDYTRRCQSLLQKGRPVSDVAYFTGEDLPSRALLPERYSPPLPEGYTADSINRDALLRLASVKDGRIVLPGGASYAMLVLPDTALMTPDLAEKILKLAAAGATIYGRFPERSPSLENYPACNDQVQFIASKLATSVEGRFITNGSLNEILKALKVSPDLLVENETDIEWAHRSSDDGEIYFISNQRAEQRLVNLSLRANGKTAELFDPLSGEISLPAARLKNGAGRIELPLQLPSHGSLFVILENFANQQTSARSSPEPMTTGEQLPGPWQVSFESQLEGTIISTTFDSLESWPERAEPAIRFHSGTATYHKTFDWNQTEGRRTWLDLGRVADIARVTLNGKDCGVAWTPPYRVEITSALQRGVNTLEIRVANTWNNRLVGDSRKSITERKTWTNAPDRHSELLPSGLLGPVTLQNKMDRPDSPHLQQPAFNP